MDKELREQIKESFRVQVEMIEKEMWTLIHRLSGEVYDTKQDQFVDACKVGKLAEAIQDIQKAISKL